MNARQVFNVARREYISRVRSKAFVFVTLAVPIFMALYILILPRLFESTDTEVLNLSVLDAGTGLQAMVTERLEAFETPPVEVVEVVESRGASPEDRRRLTDAVLAGDIDGYIVLEPDEARSVRTSYYAAQTGNPILMRDLERAVETAALERLLDGSGVDVERVRDLQRGSMETFTVSDEGEEAGGFEVTFYSTLAFCMLMYMAVMIGGQGMAMAIVEEKSSRLIEVILGAVTALEFMVGKILGVFLAGLTQLGIWIVFALVAVLYVLPAMAMGAEMAGVDLMSILNPWMIFYFSIFFALGYLLYSTLFAAFAATCTSPEEVGYALFPAMLPMILSLFLTMYAVPNPTGTVTRISSLIPLFTPMVMVARINVAQPPWWEIWLGIALLLLFIWLIAWVAAKVFRVALLIHGKRPTFAEIGRLLKAA